MHLKCKVELMNVIIAFLALLKQPGERPEKFRPERGFEP